MVMWRSCLLKTVLKLTSAGEHRKETLRWIQKEQTSRTDLTKPEGSNQTRTLHLVMPWRRLSSGGSGGFKPWWLYLVRNWVDLSKFHNSFFKKYCIVLLYLFSLNFYICIFHIILIILSSDFFFEWFVDWHIENLSISSKTSWNHHSFVSLSSTPLLFLISIHKRIIDSKHILIMFKMNIPSTKKNIYSLFHDTCIVPNFLC